MCSKHVIVNMATVSGGGGLQASVSFVESILQSETQGISFFFIFSRQVFANLDPEWTGRLRHIVLSGSPANPLFGRGCRRQIEALYQAEKPDVVYSIGFPSYVRAPKIEVGRYTNGWEFLEFNLAWQQLTFTEKIARTLRTWYRRSWAKRATHFETQTVEAKSGLVRVLGIDPERIKVFPNSLNKRFTNFLNADSGPLPPQQPYRIFCFAAEHRHKNLIMSVMAGAALSIDYGLQCKFVFTLKSDSEIWKEILSMSIKLGIQAQMCNLGPISLDESIRQYAMSHCVFVPSLAEIFSATYIEAMAMRVPIVTSDLAFAREVCGNAALYFNPTDPNSAAEAISKVLKDLKLRQCIVEEGLRKVRLYPSSEDKNHSAIEWISSL